MKTVGDLIKEIRRQNNISHEELGEMTHIKTSFIKAIEESRWDALPELPVVIGFVKSISHFLDIDEEHSVALLKREYPPKVKLPKKTIVKSTQVIWGPRLTFLALVILILVVVVGYLGFQYVKFNTPPKLQLNSPYEEEIIKTKTLTITGVTDSDATIEVNNQPVLVEASGKFTTQIEVNDKTSQVEVIAKTRSGKETVIKRNIRVQI